MTCSRLPDTVNTVNVNTHGPLSRLSVALSRSLFRGQGRAIKHTTRGARKEKYGAGVAYLNQLLEDECPGPDSPGQFKPESVQALGVGSRGGGASENVGDLATSPNMA